MKSTVPWAKNKYFGFSIMNHTRLVYTIPDWCIPGRTKQAPRHEGRWGRKAQLLAPLNSAVGGEWLASGTGDITPVNSLRYLWLGSRFGEGALGNRRNIWPLQIRNRVRQSPCLKPSHYADCIVGEWNSKRIIILRIKHWNCCKIYVTLQWCLSWRRQCYDAKVELTWCRSATLWRIFREDDDGVNNETPLQETR